VNGPGGRGLSRKELFGTIGVVAVAAVCCAFPLLAGVVAVTGLGAWLLVGIPLLALVPLAALAAIVWWRWRLR
jgi:hypothetical protein